MSWLHIKAALARISPLVYLEIMARAAVFLLFITLSAMLLVIARAPKPTAQNNLANGALQKEQKAQPELLDKERLLKAARGGGEYLLRMQKSDGSFQYSYEALHDRFENATYNTLRHTGTAYSLFELYAATHDARYLEAANRAVTFLKTRFRPAANRNALYVLDFDGKAKLGANGIALLTLAKQLELAPKQGSRDEARRLATMILNLQNANGSFDSYHPVKGNEPEGSVSLYYPGEAILGLVRLYKTDNDKRWLEAAQRGADFLIESQQKMERLPPDAWLVQALEALYNLTQNRRYFDHAMAIAESIIADQYTTDDGNEYAGAFAPGEPRVTPTASRAEAIIAAYRMAAPVRDWRESKFAMSLKAAVRFQLSQQITEENRYGLPNPQRALGGFRESLSSFIIRIDYVQHNISSLLAIAEKLY